MWHHSPLSRRLTPGKHTLPRPICAGPVSARIRAVPDRGRHLAPCSPAVVSVPSPHLSALPSSLFRPSCAPFLAGLLHSPACRPTAAAGPLRAAAPADGPVRAVRHRPRADRSAMAYLLPPVPTRRRNAFPLPCTWAVACRLYMQPARRDRRGWSAPGPSACACGPHRRGGANRARGTRGRGRGQRKRRPAAAERLASTGAWPGRACRSAAYWAGLSSISMIRPCSQM